MMETQHAPSWSPDSRWLVFPTAAGDRFALVLWRVADGRFGCVVVGNPYPLESAFPRPGTLRVAVRDDQVRAASVTRTFGAGHAQQPVRRFRASEPLDVTLDSLTLHERVDLATLPEWIAREPVHDVALVPDGFHPYDGPGLSSTTQSINGRSLEVHHLEDFADWGDPVAKEWLALARATMGDRLDRWARVAKVIGDRQA
jgi:hypothetical protein